MSETSIPSSEDSDSNNVTHNDAINQKAKYARLISAITYGGLILTFLFNNFIYIGYERTLPYTFSVVQIVPLLIFLPGLIKGSHRTHTWLCFVMLFYFMVYTVYVMSPDPTIVDIIIWVYTIILFNASMLFIRWKKRQIALQLRAS